ncbi:MAG: phospholipase A [Candidatus Aminicenantales bacterium]
MIIPPARVFAVLVIALACRLGAAPQEKPSYFTTLWHLDKATRAGLPSITFHRSSYALVFSYNTSPNPAPLQQVDPAVTLLKPEFPFQLSFKVKVLQDVFGGNMDLWFGYTQRSFWQLYNLAASAPFRETNYEPEILLNIRTDFRVLGAKARFIQFGLNHQSNGRTQPVSRTWDRVVLNAGFERGDLSVLLKSWYHIPQGFEEDKNPRLNHYMGYGELWVYYFLKNHRLGVMLRDNLEFGENRGAIQVEWSFPLFARISGYLQYFLGYGESLIDYDHRVNRIGIGFILTDWD